MNEKINYYDWLYQKCNEVNKENKKCINDDFWLRLTNIIIENKIISLLQQTVTSSLRDNGKGSKFNYSICSDNINFPDPTNSDLFVKLNYSSRIC